MSSAKLVNDSQSEPTIPDGVRINSLLFFFFLVLCCWSLLERKLKTELSTVGCGDLEMKLSRLIRYSSRFIYVRNVLSQQLLRVFAYQIL